MKSRVWSSILYLEFLTSNSLSLFLLHAMSSSSSSPIGSGRSRSSTNQSQWTSSSLEPEGYTNFSSTGFSSSPPSFTSTHPNVNFGNRSTVNSNWNPSPLSNQNQNQPTKTANPLRPDFQSRPRTSTFNSAPPTSSIPQTTQFDLNKPKIILSFEITQISISVSCIRIDSKLPVLFTESIIFDQEFPEVSECSGSFDSTCRTMLISFHLLLTLFPQYK